MWENSGYMCGARICFLDMRGNRIVDEALMARLFEVDNRTFTCSQPLLHSGVEGEGDEEGEMGRAWGMGHGG